MCERRYRCCCGCLPAFQRVQSFLWRLSRGILPDDSCCPPAAPRPPALPAELGTGDLQILMADESVAAAWENSAAARQELQTTADVPIVRRAVALGRQLLDPLALLASLCSGGGREVLALQLHALQAQVSLRGAGAGAGGGGGACVRVGFNVC